MSYQLSDDGKFAVVELVAESRAAFAQILSENRPDVKIFEPGKSRKQDVDVEIKKYIRNFDIEKLGRKGR